MKAARVRIGKIKPKPGLALLNVAQNSDRALVENWTRRWLNDHFSEHDHVAGFAFVVWTRELIANGASFAWEAGVPHLMVPEFVAKHLQANVLMGLTAKRFDL